MNKTIKRILGCAVFLIIFALLLMIVSAAFVPKDVKNESGTIDIRANAVLNEPENTIDALFIGDSECYSAFIPLRLWEKHGITSYNCGTGAQNLYYSYEFVQKAFKVHSPNVVFLETNAIYRDFSLGADIVHKVGRFFPVFTYHDRWKGLFNTGKGKDNSTGKVHIENDKGYVFKNNADPALIEDYMEYTDKIARITAQNMNYIKDIKKLCDENEVKLVLISVPSTINWNTKRHNGIRALADNLKLEYYDLNMMTDDIGIDWSKDTRDKGDHLNYSGALKVTDWLGEYIEKSNLCPNHKGDENYNQWDKALKSFYKKHKKDLQ